MPETQVAAERLQEILEEMKGLLDEAEQLIRRNGMPITYERARSYWIAHIRRALDKDHSYLGGSMFTMEETIRDLEEPEDDEEFEDEE